jgi:hypothetical protein
MIPEASISSFMKYAASLKFSENSWEEMRAFISRIVSLPAAPFEVVLDVFKGLNSIFSPETVRNFPELPAHIAILQKDAIQALRIDALAQKLIAPDSQSKKEQGIPQPKLPEKIKPSEPPQAAKAEESSNDERLNARSKKRSADGHLPEKAAKEQCRRGESEAPKAAKRAQFSDDSSSDDQESFSRARRKRGAEPHPAAAPLPEKEKVSRDLVDSRFLAESVSVFIRQHEGAGHDHPFMHGQKVYTAWAKPFEGRSIICIQEGASFRKPMCSDNKLTFSVDDRGSIASVWVNGKDTKGLNLPLDWIEIVHTALKPFVAKKRALELVERGESVINEIKAGQGGGFNVGLYRNSASVILNIIEALRVFGRTGDMDGRFEAEKADGQGSSVQPNSVRETFQKALDPDDHGGVQQTFMAMHDSPEELTPVQQEKLNTLLQSVIEFVRTLEIR